jgi:FkbM family methyltransferase
MIGAAQRTDMSVSPPEIDLDPALYRLGENAHGRYCVPVSSAHRIAAQCILKGEIYEEYTLSFMMRYAGDGDIIHAGTYFGDFLPALSRAVAAGRKVWAFEPNPENYAAAAITCRLNSLHNVELTNCAVGDRSGMLKMRVRSDGRGLGGASTIIGEGASVPEADVADIAVRRIDDVVPRSRRISLLQLDLEGFERPALEGAIETIAAWRPIILLETLPTEWYAQALAPLGYRLRGELHDNTVLSVMPVRLDARSLLRRLADRASARLYALRQR